MRWLISPRILCPIRARRIEPGNQTDRHPGWFQWAAKPRTIAETPEPGKISLRQSIRQDSFSSIFDESFPEFPDFVCDDEAEDDDVFVFKRLSKLIAEAEAEDSFSSIFDESFPEFPDFVLF